jgi:hypothetical protein
MTSISVPADVYLDLIAHLSPTDVEHVAFLFTRPLAVGSPLRVIEIYRVPPEGFDFQSDYHVELTDDVRALVIKRASDLAGCLIEAHSHTGGPPAAFSESDLYGFRDWVPHVRWRLGKRPYAALVFAGDSFDALVWEGDDDAPRPLSSLSIEGGKTNKPSLITYKRLRRKRA